MTKYEADRDALTTHPYSRMLPSDPGHDKAEQEANELSSASARSLQSLIEAPAPSYGDLRQKLDIVRAEYAELAEIIAPVIADLDRLSQLCANPDQALLDAWDRRVAAFLRYNALPNSETPGDVYTPDEKAEWAIIDEAEEVIRSHVATTPAGVAVQLWSCLQHSMHYRWSEAACLARNLGPIEARGQELDWNVRLIIAAIRSLIAIGA